MTVASIRAPAASNATFTCLTNQEEANITYQWYKVSNNNNNNNTNNNNTNGTTNNTTTTQILGQTDRNLTLINVQRDMDGSAYTCIASVNTVSGTETGTLSVPGKFDLMYFLSF